MYFKLNAELLPALLFIGYRRLGDLGTQRLGVLETWGLGDLGTQRLGVLETWGLGVLETWSPGNLETWRLGDLETWRLGDLIINRGEVAWVMYHLCAIAKTAAEQIEKLAKIK